MSKLSFRIFLIAILGLAILPLFRVLNLTWLEVLRLLLITLGLFYLYLRLTRGKEPSHSEGGFRTLQKCLPIVLALTYMFILIQFDPATSALNSVVPQSRLNWFFFLSTGLILLAGFSILPQRLRSEKRRPSAAQKGGFLRSLTLSDRIVFIVGGMTILLSLFSKWIFSFEDVNWTYSLWFIKIGEGLFLWFLITRYVFFSPSPTSASEDSLGRPSSAASLLLKTICIVFLFIIVGGGMRTTLAFYFFEKGESSLARNDVGQAFSSLKQACSINRLLDLEPLHDRCLQTIAAAYLKADSVAQAESILDKIRSQETDPHSLQKKMAAIYFEAARWPEAKFYYEKYLQSEAGDSRILDKVAFCYVKLKDASGLHRFASEHNYEIQLDFDDPESLIVLGRYYLTSGRFDDAVRLFESVQDFVLRSNYFLGMIYKSMNNPTEAKANFLKAIEREPDFADAYYHVGWCYETEGHLDSARVFYERTVEHLPDHLDGLKALGRIYGRKEME